MKHVVITGVSTGLGLSAAEVLAGANYHIFGSVRKQSDAERLEGRLGEKFTPLLFDVTDGAAIQAAAAQVEAALDGQVLNGLVNNAGIGSGGPLMHQPLDEIRHLFEVNVFGMLAVTQAFLPLLGADLSRRGPPGRIVNMSSVGGKLTRPYLASYCASKHALESFSDGLRCELNLYGIDVIVIEPGAVRTPIWDKAEEADPTPYVGTDYAESLSRFLKFFVESGRRGMEPEVIGRAVLEALESERPKARYPIPDRPIDGWLIPRLLPDRWLDRALVAQVGLQQLPRGADEQSMP